MSEALPALAAIDDDWAALRAYTPARIALGRSGVSLPTREVLGFALAHAQARDAVQAALDVAALTAALADEPATAALPVLAVKSRAADRAEYLARPDFGRRLHADSVAQLTTAPATPAPDVLFVLGDGLSAIAVQRHALPLLRALLPQLEGLVIGPLLIATQARVALADDCGEVLNARIAVSLIGERPGLSSPDSLGIYVTYGPRVGRTDAERNCISNVRGDGLLPEPAAAQTAALLRAILAAGLSGVRLRSGPGALPEPS